MENTVQIPPVLVGRHDECATLKECMASNRSEFVIVCGRRRIGKTFLVDQFFENRYDFSFVGKHKTKTQTQLNYFAKAIQKYSGQKQKTYADWYDAFDALEYYLETLPVNRKKSSSLMKCLGLTPNAPLLSVPLKIFGTDGQTADMTLY